MKLENKELREMERLSTSPYFLKLADSILQNLDRNFLAELIAEYFFLKSKGATNTDFILYIGTTKAPKLARLSLGMGSTVIQGLLFDKEFRNLLLDLGKKSFSRSV